MKDDERRLLGAAQSAGRIVPVDGMTDGRLSQLRGKWTRMKLLDADGNLTGKGLGASGGFRPVEPIACNDVSDETITIGRVFGDQEKFRIRDTGERLECVPVEDVTVCEPEDFDDEEYDDA
jgi:hypothetical protein